VELPHSPDERQRIEPSRLPASAGNAPTTPAAQTAWIKAHPRFDVTYTPKHASWLNMIEQWFSILARKLLRRGSFESREDLENQITEFTIGCNKTAHPWKWKYDADSSGQRCL
jgi:transposase